MLRELLGWHILALATALGATRSLLWLWLLTSLRLVVFRRAVRTSTSWAPHSLPEHPEHPAHTFPLAAVTLTGTAAVVPFLAGGSGGN